MELYEKIINWALWKFVLLFKSRVRIIYTNNKKYLLRVYIKQTGKLPGIYLHRFYASDEDEHLHDHPFEKSYSFILCGKYLEEKLGEDKRTIFMKSYFPGKINIIGANDFHRVKMVRSPIWTLFIPTKRNKSWGYWDIGNQKFIPWNEYTDSHGNYITDLEGNLRKLYE